MVDVDVATNMKEIEKDLGLWKKRSLITGPADTQLWERRGDSGKSKAEVFADHGIEWIPADKGPGSKVSNSEKFLKRLKDHGRGSMIPGIVFFDTCVNCLRTIPRIGTDINNSEAPRDGGDDHWLDAVLYMCGFASHGRASIPSFKKDDEDDEWYDQHSTRKDNVKRHYGYGM